jgi:hypothetical protein
MYFRIAGFFGVSPEFYKIENTKKMTGFLDCLHSAVFQEIEIGKGGSPKT